MNFSKDAVQAMFGMSHTKQHQWEVLLDSLKENRIAKLEQLSSAPTMDKVKFLQGEISTLDKLIYHYSNPKKILEEL